MLPLLWRTYLILSLGVWRFSLSAMLLLLIRWGLPATCPSCRWTTIALWSRWAACPRNVILGTYSPKSVVPKFLIIALRSLRPSTSLRSWTVRLRWSRRNRRLSLLIETNITRNWATFSFRRCCVTTEMRVVTLQNLIMSRGYALKRVAWRLWVLLKMRSDIFCAAFIFRWRTT